ncbi:hypothetical protein DXG03_000350 [Asterophora parasitica]|uniref:Uncharacterized protein n=1 Tax=Asterophora parasitica TaxID=117018 RepID=A0A9P7KEC6_9AGAR|nr:hypothetical protein DXG03_000350 [Asterophora parasitica]
MHWSIELISSTRSGALGSGATVVRTPDDALRETRVRLTFDGKTRDDARSPSPEGAKSRNSIASDKARCDTPGAMETISPMDSPPLPPVPMPDEEECDLLDAEPMPEPEPEAPKQPPRPTRAPPPAPSQSLRPSLKSKPVPVVEEVNHVPPLPSNISPNPVPPAFRPILVSEVPTGVVDPSKIIVTLETSTATHKTTLDTLTSRPSHLSKYLSFLFPPARGSTASSVYSDASDDMSTYRHHLTCQGLLPQTSFNVHIFLDRSSAPYVPLVFYTTIELITLF